MVVSLLLLLLLVKPRYNRALMAETLGCPHAVDENGKVVCGLLRAFDGTVNNLNRVWRPHKLAVSDGEMSIGCGIATASKRNKCIGSHIPRERIHHLFNAAHANVVLTAPENGLKWAAIFAATADRFLGR